MTDESTTRRCIKCGAAYTGETHGGCGSQRVVGARPEEIPAEARPFIEDATRILNHYVLVEKVGQGGMGAVWKAWDRKLTRWIAIKLLLTSESEDLARFLREAQLAARLRHPNIAMIHEVGEAPPPKQGDSPRPYIAMEFVDGTSLKKAELSIPETVEIFIKVAQGVEAAHRGGVVHRDLKPQNIMLTRDKWPFVMDFGLAKTLQAGSSISASGAILGTPAFMSPEQAQGASDQVDAKSDVYSLGATMYSVFCKKAPYSADSAFAVLLKICKEDPPPPRTHRPELHPDLEKIIVKAMARDRGQRYPTAAALAEDLQKWLESSRRLVPGAAPASAPKQGNPALLVLAAGVVALVIALGVIFSGKKDPVPVVKNPETPMSDPPSGIKVTPPDVKPPDPAPDPGPQKVVVVERKPHGRPLPLAVFPFARARELITEAPDRAQDFVMLALAETKRFAILERDVVVKAVAGESPKSADWDRESVVRVGRLIKAAQVATGTVAETGRKTNVSVRLWDVATGDMIAARDAAYEGEENLKACVQGVVRDLESALERDAKSRHDEAALARRREKPDVARKQFQSVLGLWPSTEAADDALLDLVRMDFEEGAYGPASEGVDRLLEEYPYSTLVEEGIFLQGECAYLVLFPDTKGRKREQENWKHVMERLQKLGASGELRTEIKARAALRDKARKAYLLYLKEYPKGPHAAQAAKRLEEMTR